MRRRRNIGGLPGSGRPSGAMTGYSKLRTGSVWLPVHHAAGASSDTQDAADTLATQLGRMAAPDPVRAQETGSAAIVVSVDSSLGSDFRLYRDNAVIRLTGSSERGVRLGVWDLLRRLGHKRLGTTDEWEIVPALGAALDLHLPGHVYYQYRFFTGFGSAGGLMPDQQPRLDTWREENSIEDDGDWNTGHSWGLYVSERNPPTAWKSSTGNKLHAEIPALVTDFVAWQVARFATGENVCVSSAAADGLGGWSEIPMHPSDAQLTLANAVAAADVQTAILAYGYMSKKPSFTIDPSILVVCATAFMQYGMTADDVRAAYIAAGAVKTASYEYPFVWNWETKNLPGADRGTLRSELALMLDRIPDDMGLKGEGGPVWAIGGRYYNATAAAMRGEDALAAWDDFPAAAFPNAVAEAEDVYEILSTRVTVDDALLETLDTAVIALLDSGISGDELERAVDLGRYAVFCHLWINFDANKTTQNFDDFLHWVTRIRDRDLVDYKSVYNDSALEPYRLAVAAVYNEEDLSPFNPVWVDSDDIPDEAEVRTQLAAL